MQERGREHTKDGGGELTIALCTHRSIDVYVNKTRNVISICVKRVLIHLLQEVKDMHM